ncbi:MAG TPA: acyl-CoA reductase [Gemmatimonadota bacterium]
MRASAEAAEIRSVCELRALKGALGERLRSGAPPLARRVEVLAEVSARWRRRRDPFRLLAVARLGSEAGLSPASAEAGLDATLVAWTPRAWRTLAEREVAGGGAPPGVVPHVLAGALPGPALLPLFFTLLAGGAPMARAGRRAPSLPALGLASVAAVDPELGARGAVCRWPRGRADLLAALFEDAAVGSATGGDAAVAAVRAHVPTGVRLLAHPSRTSVAAVAAGALARDRDVGGAARRLARDVTLHDQAGCLSPVGVLVVGGGASAAERLAAALARELERTERRRPRLRPDPDEAAALRAFHDSFAAAGRRRVHAGEGLAWVVGRLAPGERPPASPLLRSVWVLPVPDAAGAERALAAWRGRLAGFGVLGTPSERSALRAVGRALGASWLPRAGRLQSPPLAWRADGIRPVADLLGPRP